MVEQHPLEDLLFGARDPHRFLDELARQAPRISQFGLFRVPRHALKASD